jgi:hypothetical protein
MPTLARGDTMRTLYREVVIVRTNYDGRWKHTKPKTLSFGTHKLFVRGWTDALQKLCDKIAFENPVDFSLVLTCIGYEERPYFGSEDEMHGDCRPYKVSNTEIYVRCGLTANNHKDLCDALCLVFGYAPLRVELW